MSLAARALRTIRKYDLFPRGARVLVAVSGGPDSVALLHILRVLEGRGELAIAGLAHFNHGLRGADADDDERFCRDLAAASRLPIEVGRGDVTGEARASGRSIEDAARHARYAFLGEAAGRLQADAVAVGHSLEDQAETFLLRLLRGAGARGLGGIRPRAGLVVRPLLEISRADLRRHAADYRLAFREDASNQDAGIPRNRIRKELIPYLEEYAPAIVPILAREARLAREDEEYLNRVAVEVSGSIVSRTDSGAEVDAHALGVLPPALAARVARQALEGAVPQRFIGLQHIDRVLELAHAREGASVTLPGLVATRQGRTIVLGGAPPPAFSNSFRVPLSIPGEAFVPGWAVSAEVADHTAETPPARGGLAVVAAGPLSGPLAIRTRRRGDRFRPLGMGGRGRKLQDFLVDRKIGRIERDWLPLVVNREDRIVWVVGESVAEDFRVTEPGQGVIILKARRLGGLG